MVTSGGALHELPDSLARAIESAKVPALPQVLIKLLQLADDDAATMSEMAALVEKDPGLCTRLLTAANSPGLRRGSELRSIAHCLASLGTRLIRSITTCLALQNLFSRRHDTVRHDLTAYWRHSIRVAESAREIAIDCGYPQPDEAYLGGLLHDVGELILLSAQGSAYAQLLARATDEAHLAALESEHLGVHHGEVGAWLVDQWQFDADIADGIMFHHATADDIVTAGLLPQIVWLAHALATTSPDDPAVAALAARMPGLATTSGMGVLSRRALERTEQIAEAIGVAPDTAIDGVPLNTFPQVSAVASDATDSAAEGEIDALMRDAALMQPLQRDLFGVDSDAELLLSLRESARILFDLSHIAFFLHETDGEHLSAARFGSHSPLFRRATIPIDAPRCLVAAAARTRQPVCSFDEDYAQPAALIDLQFARVFGTDGLLCVPMNGRQGTLGVMVFGLSAAQHGRLKRKLPWVLNFGRIAAISLEAWNEAMRRRQLAENDASARFQQKARRVVHEAGNPLSIIRSYLKILDGKLPADAPMREELGILREEIDRVTTIVRQLSEAPQHDGGTQGFDVSEQIRELLAFYEEPLFKARGIQVQLLPGDATEPVVCDRDSLRQVLINLWKNAAESLPQGGRVDISVSGGVVHNGRRHVELRITDNGPGIPADMLARLSPAAPETTATDRGIGLSIVGELISRMGATISCRTRPGAGTAFTLMLPCRP